LFKQHTEVSKSSLPSSLALLRLRGDSSVTVKVKTLRYKKTAFEEEVLEVEVQERASVFDLKRQLAILKGYPASQDDLTAKTAMRIIHLGKILNDDVVVASVVRPPSFVVMLPPKTLQQTSTKTLARDLAYEQAHLAQFHDLVKDGRPTDARMIQYKNFDLCEACLPMWWWECKGCYICTNCDMKFAGPVIFKEEKEECAIFLETTIKQAKITPHCSHWFCVPCARKIVGFDAQWLEQYQLSTEGGIYEQWCKECPEESQKYEDDTERTLGRKSTCPDMSAFQGITRVPSPLDTTFPRST